MSVPAADFQKQLILIGRKNRRYPSLIPEMQAIAAGLSTDTTTHDRTIRLHPPPVRIGRDKTPVTNAVLHVVNRGKAGNLANATMGAIINSSIALISPPINTVPPVITNLGDGTVGSQLVNTNPGTWSPPAVPSNNFTRQWLRNGANIAGATANNYTTVTADGGTSVSIRVTAINANGSTPVVSNAIAITP